MLESSDAWHNFVPLSALIVLASFVATAGLILLLFPVFGRFAVAIRTHRSSHNGLTPQWGGLPVIMVTVGAAAIAIAINPSSSGSAVGNLYVLLGGIVLLALLGIVDDIHNLGAATKLAIQILAVGLVVAGLPSALRLSPAVPFWIERGAIFLGVLWFVNLTNFMDGIDWMMVAEVVPITAGVALIAALGDLPPEVGFVALTLNGAMLGFALFNRPVARLFLGDMGSLPIGLLLGWFLLLIAGAGYPVAALLLPLYFLLDASITLVRRIWRRERVWEGHRTHFYQRASDNGFSNMQIVGGVFAVNVALAGLAVLTLAAHSRAVEIGALVAGVMAVATLLSGFARLGTRTRSARSNRGSGNVL
jgi:UDP-N-acetylmuramyl pentapeptide phosphotransferase/UDP-N-acetylglucosamine-1-phosphate transferase